VRDAKAGPATLVARPDAPPKPKTPPKPKDRGPK
jgi:hypothetical protein